MTAELYCRCLRPPMHPTATTNSTTTNVATATVATTTVVTTTSIAIVAAALIAGGFRPVWASHYVATRMSDRVQAGVPGRIPRDPGVPETSLWLEKTVPAAGSLTYG